MSNTNVFNHLIMFTIIFLGLSTLYGTTLPGFQNTISAPEQCLLNNSPPSTCSFPAFSPPIPQNITTSQNAVSTPFPQCLLYIPSCFNGAVGTIASTAQAIWNGLALLDYAVALIPIYGYIFFNKLFNGILLMTIIFNLINTDYGVPFLSYFFFAFTLLFIFFGIAVLKPGGHGA